MVSRLRPRLARTGARAWVAREDTEPSALALVEALEWDSRVLGIPAGRLEIVSGPSASTTTVAALIDAAVRAATEIGIRHLSARVDAADDMAIHALESRGFLNVDALMTFAAAPSDLTKTRPRPRSDLTVRTASPSDRAPVAALAESAFRYGRFHSDPSISSARAAAVYRTWAAACCEGSAADAVMLAEADGALAGFVACRLHADTTVHLGHAVGTIPLIATSEAFQGRGIGASLVRAAGAWFCSRHAGAVEIGTQLRNVAAARLYERCGFRLVGGSISFRLMVTP